MLNTSISLWVGMCLSISAICSSPSITDNLSNNNCTSVSEMCNEKPLIYCPAFVWLKPSESAHPNRTGYALADPGGPNCGTPIVTYTDEIFIINACHKVYTRIWTATDPNNPSLQDTCHQTIKQVDEEPPVLDNMPDDIIIYTDNMDPNTINCSTKVSWFSPHVYDNHLLTSLEITAVRNGVELDLQSGDFFYDGITTITYTAYDFCGNFSTASFDINVMCADCHLDCPDDVCLPLNSDITPQAVGTATAYTGNTNCGTVTTYYLDELLDTGCNGKTKTRRTWYGVFDNMPQNTSTCVQTIELKDMSALVLYNCPSDVNVVDNFTKAQWEPPVAVASDNANIITMTSNYGPGNFFPVGITTVIYTATDACGNEATCSFKVSVLSDATYENCPDDIEITCGPGGSVTVTWDEPTYEGSCTTCKRGTPIYGLMYMGSLNGSSYYCSTRDYTYEEAIALAEKHGGHIASINSQEENEYLADRIISSTAMIGYTDIANEGHFVWEDGSSSSYSNWYQMQPNDHNNQDVVELMKSSGLWNDVENDKKLEVILEFPCQNVKQIDGPKPGQNLPPGTYTVEYEISDGCGLSKFCKFDITVSAGISVLCLDDIYVEVPTATDQISVSWEAPIAYSCCADCSGQSCLTIEQTEGPVSGSNFDRQSKTTITYVITDLCGNTSTCSFYILVDIDEISGRTSNDSDTYLPSEETEYNHDSTGGDNIENNEMELAVEETNTEAVKDEELVIKPFQKSIVKDKFYPNPMSEIFNMEFSDHSNVISVTIYDQNGRVILLFTKDIYKNKQVDVSRLASGVYILQIQYLDAEIVTHKLVKI